MSSTGESDKVILPGDSTPDVLGEIGRRVRRVRLRQDRTMEAVAREAGVGARTLLRLEAGEGSTLTTLISVLRALDVLGDLDGLLPDPVFYQPRRSRASGRRHTV